MSVPAEKMTPAAPAATPGPESSTPAGGDTTSSGGGEDFDYGALVSDDVEVSDPTPTTEGKVAAPESPPATPPASPAPAVTPPAQVPPAAAAATPPQPSIPPTEPQASQPPAAPAEAPAPGVVPEQMSPEKHREQFLPVLEKLYGLSDAEVEALQADPGKVLPGLAAKLHYEVQMATFQGLLQVIPSILQSQIKGQQEVQKNVETFYSKWPKLKEAVSQNPALDDVVGKVIRAYRTVNPKATLEQIINEAGMMAAVHLKIPLDLPGAAAPSAPGAGGVPPQPAVVPARPAGVGSTGHAPRPQVPGQDESVDDVLKGLVDAELAGQLD